MATLLPHTTRTRTSQMRWERAGHQVLAKSTIPKRLGSCVMFSSSANEAGELSGKKRSETDININRDGTTRGNKSNVANWNNTECWKTAINLGDSLSELKNRALAQGLPPLDFSFKANLFRFTSFIYLVQLDGVSQRRSLCWSTTRWVLLKTKLFWQYVEFYGDSHFRVLFWAFCWEVFIARTIWLDREDS